MDRECDVLRNVHLERERAFAPIMSLAAVPTMWTPSTSCVFAFATTLKKPSISLFAIARPSAAYGNFPTRTSMPFSFACVSDKPATAIFRIGEDRRRDRQSFSRLSDRRSPRRSLRLSLRRLVREHRESRPRRRCSTRPARSAALRVRPRMKFFSTFTPIFSRLSPWLFGRMPTATSTTSVTTFAVCRRRDRDARRSGDRSVSA